MQRLAVVPKHMVDFWCCHCLPALSLVSPSHRTNRFSYLRPSSIRNCSPFYRNRRKVGLLINRRVLPKTSADSESQTCTATITRVKGTKHRPRRLAYSIRLLIRIMSLPPPLRGTATAKEAKVTANLSRSMATLDLKRSRTKVSTPPCG